MKRATAARRTVKAFRDLGRVEPIDTSLAEHMISLAEDLDALPVDHPNFPRLVDMFQRTEAELHDRFTADDSNTESFADLLSALSD